MGVHPTRSGRWPLAAAGGAREGISECSCVGAPRRDVAENRACEPRGSALEAASASGQWCTLGLWAVKGLGLGGVAICVAWVGAWETEYRKAEMDLCTSKPFTMLPAVRLATLGGSIGSFHSSSSHARSQQAQASLELCHYHYNMPLPQLYYTRHARTLHRSRLQWLLIYSCPRVWSLLDPQGHKSPLSSCSHAHLVWPRVYVCTHVCLYYYRISGGRQERDRARRPQALIPRDRCRGSSV